MPLPSPSSVRGAKTRNEKNPLRSSSFQTQQAVRNPIPWRPSGSRGTMACKYSSHKASSSKVNRSPKRKGGKKRERKGLLERNEPIKTTVFQAPSKVFTYIHDHPEQISNNCDQSRWGIRGRAMDIRPQGDLKRWDSIINSAGIHPLVPSPTRKGFVLCKTKDR